MTRALLALLLAGCASQQEYFLTAAQGPDGNIVRVLEMPNALCPEVLGPNGGCYFQHVVMGYGVDADARRHELDHVAGLRHGKWDNGCARILASGYTRWTAGKMMCRSERGGYYER